MLRYTDVLLMDAEARIATADYDGAVKDINALRTRSGLGTVSFSNTTDGNAALQAAWKSEKYRQGDRYASLLRWGMAQGVLGAGGWHLYNTLMPVPQNFLDAYPGLMQNPGY